MNHMKMHYTSSLILYGLEIIYGSAGLEPNGNTESETKYDKLIGCSYNESHLRRQDSDSGARNTTTLLSDSLTYVHICQSVVILVTQKGVMKVHDISNDFIVPNTQELEPKFQSRGGVATVRSWVRCVPTDLVQASVDVLILPLPPETVDERMM